MTALEMRFWSHVSIGDGCWNWTGSRQHNGYGRTWANGRQETASRMSWLFSAGVSAPRGMDVCHHCDNPSCVRPSHLFLGTRAENMADMDAKGRRRPPTGARHGSVTKPHRVPRGERIGLARLTEDGVREIRSRLAEGESQRSLARSFGVSHTAINNIAKRATWAHVGDGSRR